MSDLPPVDVVIIATPDNAIEATAERLAREVELSPQTLVLHLSGAKTIQVLQAVTAQGALAGSLHPVFAFANVEHSVAHLAGNLCAIEAEHAQAVEILQQLANALGLTAFVMPSEYKARYHAAMTAEEQAAYRVWAQMTLNLAAARLDKQSVEKVQAVLNSGIKSV
ncbi:DUF2520 domain-containing protein [Neisseria weixii]|uniref:DUF2520 domain-containing protein n=2 Tax=Neisseria weixii TaxID=1853276 RepID=A0A3N4MTU8_9NEIS|nr:hypothetical protein CGZ65_00725 [Neisseria weixii]RPD85076.1 DUF2520 domain-containing protein [Neisseria weixii]RPD86035.1 DUF2520 domain-containing protein [Neisseria weixii]